MSGLFADVVRSEWTKLRTVRSTWGTLAGAAVLSLGFGPPIVGWVLDATPAPERATDIDPVAVTYGGFHIAIVAFALVGVLAVAGEHSTGMIRVTHIAVPRRLTVLGAKAVAVAAVSLPVGVVVSLATFLLGQRALARDGLDVSLGDPGVARAVVGAGLFAAACSVLGVALGALVRHTTGAVTLSVLVLFGAQLVTDVLPPGVARVVPHWAGFALFTLDPDRFDSPPMLAPWTGFALFCAYVAATLGVAAVLVQRRDL
jgi:ABC-2 type transport system permease protein